LAVQPFVARPALAAASPVDRIFDFYRSLKTFTADFEQVKTLKAEGLTLKSSGRLTVTLGSALLWEIRKPAHLAVFVGRERLVIQSGDGAAQKTTTYALKAAAYSEKLAEGLRELTPLLAMDRAALEERYTVTDSYAPAHPTMQITLRPKTVRQFSKVDLVRADGYDAWIESIYIDEASGDTMRLTFAKPVKGDASWADAWKAPAKP
jgi:hypothetical protein